MGSIDYSAVRSSGTNKVSSITERMALDNIELKDKLERQIKYFELKKQSIIAALEVLSKTEKLIIKKHYIEGVPMKQIEYLVGCSGAGCSEKRKNALEALNGILSVNFYNLNNFYLRSKYKGSDGIPTQNVICHERK